MRRVFSDFDQTTTDCLEVNCFVRATLFAGGEVENFDFPLSFDPNSDAPPPAAVSVSPVGLLSDLQSITVTGTDFAPSELSGGQVVISQCSAGSAGRGTSSTC